MYICYMIIQMEGKQYKREGAPAVSQWGGNWFFLYNEKWHKVINYGIKIRLNDLSNLL